MLNLHDKFWFVQKLPLQQACKIGYGLALHQKYDESTLIICKTAHLKVLTPLSSKKVKNCHYTQPS